MSSERAAYLYAGAAVLMWSTVATAFKLTLAELPIPSLVLIASATSALVLFVAVVIRGELPALALTLRTAWGATLLRAALNPALYYPILLGAYARLPAQVAQPINYTWAIVLTVLSAVVLRQKITRHDYIAAVACYLGVLLIATAGDVSGASFADGIGLALVLVSTVIWATFWLLDMRDERPALIGMCLNFAVALPLLGAWCAFVPGAFAWSWQGAVGAVYIGLFEMSLAFLAWSAALRLSPNSSWVSNMIFLSPFISLQLIAVVLGESIHATTWSGLGFIVAGLSWQQWHKRFAR
tara:strand:+ start:601 stop:1488 length:888 start_codon:yes stop_codon:yes gene_type:complete